MTETYAEHCVRYPVLIDLPSGASDVITFKYRGGPYVDVGEFTDLGSRKHYIAGRRPYRKEFKVYDVINVWDYVENKSILQSKMHLRMLCEQWLRDHEQDLDNFRETINIKRKQSSK